MNDSQFKFSPFVIVLPFFSVLILWVLYWLDIRFQINFSQYGIYPRTFSGLKGLFFSPFIHGSLEHLYNNSLPIFLLLVAMRFFYRKQFAKVVGFGILCSGMLTWIIGRGDSYHIGASGLIYVLVSFIFFKGIYTAHYRLVALSLLIVLVYGSLVWYVFPNIQEGISWEGHLAGFITGFVLARQLSTPEFKKAPKYEWEFPDYNPENDEFMQCFDEKGNFVNPTINQFSEENSTDTITVVYDYIENDKKL
jgi:membrane associated rhomboid family serine protease